MVWCGVVWCGVVVWRGVVWCGVVRCDAVWYGAVSHLVCEEVLVDLPVVDLLLDGPAGDEAVHRHGAQLPDTPRTLTGLRVWRGEACHTPGLREGRHAHGPGGGGGHATH